jgi:hypothetical protein
VVRVASAKGAHPIRALLYGYARALSTRVCRLLLTTSTKPSGEAFPSDRGSAQGLVHTERRPESGVTKARGLSNLRQRSRSLREA